MYQPKCDNLNIFQIKIIDDLKVVINIRTLPVKGGFIDYSKTSRFEKAYNYVL